MTEEISIQSEPRTVVGKQVRALRRQGLVPGTVYGPSAQPYNIQLNAHELEMKLLHIGSSQLIKLVVDGQQVNALIRDVQRNPLRGSVVHIDFYAVNMSTKMTAQVPLHFTGHSEPVHRGDAVLYHALNEIEIECLPANLPAALEVDLNRLKTMDDAIYVRDLTLPQGVELREDPDELVVRLTLVATEAEVEQAAQVSPEVEIIARPRGEEVEG